MPTISLRCALYGNSREITAVLAEAEKKYGKTVPKFDPKQFAPSNMGLPEVKDRKKNDNILAKFEVEEANSNDDEVINNQRKHTIAVYETPRAALK